MSNPTELPDLAQAVRKLVKAKGRFHTEQNYKELADALARYDARRAQPEVEAPQADLRRSVKAITRLLIDREWADVPLGDPDAVALFDAVDALVSANNEARVPAATLSPLCGAQHAESGASDLDAFGAWKSYPLPDLNSDGHFDKDWLHREFVAFKAGRRAALASRPAEVDDWISVDDERKPVLGEAVLLYVRTLTRGYIDDMPCKGEGAEIAMGEYRWGDESEYFDCYTSPISDHDWITHWRKMPAAPSHTTNKAK